MYIISYREPNRNDEIVNINEGNSVQTPFYLQAMVVAGPSVGANSSPALHSFPIDPAFVGTTFFHNPWALDPDGDSLAFRLVFPMQDKEQVVPNFELPNDSDFYLESASTGNEEGSDFPSFDLNPITGDLVWDAPGSLLINSVGPFSEYNITFIIEEWRMVSGSWTLIGYVTRDMLIIASEQTNMRPHIELPPDQVIAVGQTLEETLNFSDGDEDLIKVEFFGEPLLLNEAPMTVSSQPDGYVSGPFSATVQWNPIEAHKRNRPYLLHAKITDDPGGNQLQAVTYKTWVLSFESLPSVEAPEIELLPGSKVSPDKDVITGLEAAEKLKTIILYPNPVEKVLNWSVQETTFSPNQKIFVYDIRGKPIINWQLVTSNRIYVDNLSPGIYFLRLFSGDEWFGGRFFKK